MYNAESVTINIQRLMTKGEIRFMFPAPGCRKGMQILVRSLCRTKSSSVHWLAWLASPDLIRYPDSRTLDLESLMNNRLSGIN